jgi:phasin family protein
MTTKPTNPFFPFADFDASKFDLSKLVADLKVPGLDTQALLDAQRKNLEALTQANRLAVEGMQAVAKRQAEILAQAMSEGQKAAAELRGSSGPRELTAKQAELAKEAFEKAIANMRELADMVSKSNNEAFTAINQRVVASLDELKALASKK